MIGAAIIVVLLIVVFPVTIALSGAAGAFLIGWAERVAADKRHEGSELVDLNG